VDEKRLYQLLHDFSLNRISRDDYNELMQYLRETAGDEPVDAIIERLWSELPPAIQLTDDEAGLLYTHITENPRFASENPVPWYRQRWLRYAAMLAVLIGAGTIGWLSMRKTQAPAIAYEEIAAAAGSRLHIVLPDSTDVWLNNGSRLRYPAAFTGNTREMHIKGEVFFDVSRRAAQPFIVHSGNVSVKVLGTSFSVKAYDSSSLAVTVVTGKVSVAAGAAVLGMLEANQRLQYNPQNGSVNIATVVAGDLVAWKKGELIFDNVTMEEAATIMERWYNVSFRFANPSLRKCRFSLSFVRGENLKQVMNMISRLNGFNYQISNDTVSISGKGC
jgi:transmembrane sensor